MQALRGAGGSPAVLAANEEHVQYCFDVLSAHLSGDSGPSPTFDESYWWVTFSLPAICSVAGRYHKPVPLRSISVPELTVGMSG